MTPPFCARAPFAPPPFGYLHRSAVCICAVAVCAVAVFADLRCRAVDRCICAAAVGCSCRHAAVPPRRAPSPPGTDSHRQVRQSGFRQHQTASLSSSLAVRRHQRQTSQTSQPANSLLVVKSSQANRARNSRPHRAVRCIAPRAHRRTAPPTPTVCRCPGRTTVTVTVCRTPSGPGCQAPVRLYQAVPALPVLVLVTKLTLAYYYPRRAVDAPSSFRTVHHRHRPSIVAEPSSVRRTVITIRPSITARNRPPIRRPFVVVDNHHHPD